MPEPARNGDAGARVVRVLEVDPDLGADLDPRLLAGAARELVAPLVDVEWSARKGRCGREGDLKAAD